MFWGRVAPMLGLALSRGDHHQNLGQVRESLEQQESMLWLVIEEGDQYTETAIVGALVSYISNDDLFVWLMAGRELSAWAPDVSPMLVRYAKEHDLARVKAVVRPGMVLLLRHLGWRHRQSIVTIEV